MGNGGTQIKDGRVKPQARALLAPPGPERCQTYTCQENTSFYLVFWYECMYINDRLKYLICKTNDKALKSRSYEDRGPVESSTCL